MVYRFSEDQNIAARSMISMSNWTEVLRRMKYCEARGSNTKIRQQYVYMSQPADTCYSFHVIVAGRWSQVTFGEAAGWVGCAGQPSSAAICSTCAACDRSSTYAL